MFRLSSLRARVECKIMGTNYSQITEEVVRWPQALTTPPQFLLKPGRGWPDRLRSAVGEGHNS
jgi:hypothetical protein